jgi:hypothetical protein
MVVSGFLNMPNMTDAEPVCRTFVDDGVDRGMQQQSEMRGALMM